MHRGPKTQKGLPYPPVSGPVCPTSSEVPSVPANTPLPDRLTGPYTLTNLVSPSQYAPAW